MDQVLKQKLEIEAKEEEKKLKEMEQRFQVMKFSFLYIIQTIIFICPGLQIIS